MPEPAAPDEPAVPESPAVPVDPASAEPPTVPGVPGTAAEPLQSISALTLATVDMAASVAFYEALGFFLLYGGPDAPFTSFRVGPGYLNLQRVDEAPSTDWGRAVLWVDDVDTMHARAVTAGFEPEAPPADAPWGERFFHLRDPNGHELSFARPLAP